MAKLLNAASTWKQPRSRYLTLWHGCTSDDKNAILENNIDVTVGSINADFGRGFYTTTLERQARHWAWLRYFVAKAHSPDVQPIVLKFRVDRHKLAKLQWLAFVMSDYHNEDYWSLVQRCRQSVPGDINDHQGPVSDGQHRWYDVVYGPVAAFWQQRSAMLASDQMSFHTPAAAALLNVLLKSGKKADFDWKPIT